MGNGNLMHIIAERKLMMGSLIAGYVRRTVPVKQILTLLLSIGISVTLGYHAYTYLKKDITVDDNGNTVFARTMESNLNNAFNQMGIKVEDYDYISSPLTTSLLSEAPNDVTIKRAVPVSIYVDGNTRDIMTYMDTVEEAVENAGIVLGPLDKYDGVSPGQTIREGMEIRVLRIREEMLAEQESIPFETVENPNNSMNRGENRTIREGEDGILEKYYKLTYNDGKRTAKEYLEEKTILEPVEKIVEYGTVPNFTSSRGDLVRYTKTIDMKATAYTSSFEDTLKHPDHPEFGICYTGLKAREGIIAVDPKVIPLWTKVYVEVVDGPDYGFALAGDIGSAIKGNLVDLYFDSEYSVKQWGVRKVRIYVLNEQDDARWKSNTTACK